ncbi:hypothetical protein QBC32DRAFT_121355 [Pseudoneurospora amorphoporcata]|uniref:Uncharacterized protein n=1 Tax=Pseudoneurospora amorphoporcata TaxID=241081 RepID=A0AAN6NKE4_9PEZI|nr:hypothetical protein QBC32DRAFT_121355 [Pseudoneurospora amorphoporcata]
MDRSGSPPYRERRGPHIHVHLEVGISWTSKKQPKNHEVTYGSRGSKAVVRENEQFPGPRLPRQMSAPDPTYLAAIHDFEQRRSRTRENRKAARPAPTPAPQLDVSIPDARLEHYHLGSHHQMQEYYQVAGYYGPAQHATSSRQQRRRSRSGSKSAWERGQSAPPPTGDNPWDVGLAGDQAAGPSNARPDMSPRPPSDVWKALPAAPNQFRLGEAGMPWSSPMVFDTGAGSNDDVSDLPSAHHRQDSIPTFHPDDEASIYEASPVTGISVFSPGPSKSHNREDSEPASVHDLEELSAAMVTVDNGFENQWWNQGQRRSMMPPAPIEEPPSLNRRISVRSLGWAVANNNTPPQEEIPSMSSIAASDIVSPLSEYSTLAFSPPTTHHTLHRSISTRSADEMWLTTRDL